MAWKHMSQSFSCVLFVLVSHNCSHSTNYFYALINLIFISLNNLFLLNFFLFILFFIFVTSSFVIWCHIFVAILFVSVIIAFAYSIDFLFRLKKIYLFFIFLSCYCLSNLRRNTFFNHCSSFWREQEHVYLSLESMRSQFSSVLIFHPYLITLGFKTMWLKTKK